MRGRVEGEDVRDADPLPAESNGGGCRAEDDLVSLAASHNGNTTERCVDCGVHALVTHPIRVPVGTKRSVVDVVCGRCYLKRGEFESAKGGQ